MVNITLNIILLQQIIYYENRVYRNIFTLSIHILFLNVERKNPHLCLLILLGTPCGSLIMSEYFNVKAK